MRHNIQNKKEGNTPQEQAVNTLVELGYIQRRIFDKDQTLTFEEKAKFNQAKSASKASAMKLPYRIRGINQQRSINENVTRNEGNNLNISWKSMEAVISANEFTLEVNGKLTDEDTITLQFNDELEARPELVQASGVINGIRKKERRSKDQLEKYFKEQSYYSRGRTIELGNAKILKTEKVDGKQIVTLRCDNENRNFKELGKYIKNTYAIKPERLFKGQNGEDALSSQIVKHLNNELVEFTKSCGFNSSSILLEEYQKGVYALGVPMEQIDLTQNQKFDSHQTLIDCADTTIKQITSERNKYKNAFSNNAEKIFPELAEEKEEKKVKTPYFVKLAESEEERYKTLIGSTATKLQKIAIKAVTTNQQTEKSYVSVTMTPPDLDTPPSFIVEDALPGEKDDFSNIIESIVVDVAKYNENISQREEERTQKRIPSAEIEITLQREDTRKKFEKRIEIPSDPKTLHKLRHCNIKQLKGTEFEYKNNFIKTTEYNISNTTDRILNIFQFSNKGKTPIEVVQMARKLAQKMVANSGREQNPIDRMTRSIVGFPGQPINSPFRSREDAISAFEFITRQHSYETRPALGTNPILLKTLVGINKETEQLSPAQQIDLGIRLASNPTTTVERVDNIIGKEESDAIATLVQTAALQPENKETLIKEATKKAAELLINLEIAKNATFDENTKNKVRIEPNEPTISDNALRNSEIYTTTLEKLSNSTKSMQKIEKLANFRIESQATDISNTLAGLDIKSEVEIDKILLTETGIMESIDTEMSELLGNMTSENTTHRAIEEFAKAALELDNNKEVKVLVNSNSGTETFKITESSENDKYNITSNIQKLQKKIQNITTANEKEIEAIEKAKISHATTIGNKLKEFKPLDNKAFTKHQELKEIKDIITLGEKALSNESTNKTDKDSIDEKKYAENQITRLPILCESVIKDLNESYQYLKEKEPSIMKAQINAEKKVLAIYQLRGMSNPHAPVVDINLDTKEIKTNRVWIEAHSNYITSDVIGKAEEVIKNANENTTGKSILNSLLNMPEIDNKPTIIKYDPELYTGKEMNPYLGEEHMKNHIGKNKQGTRILQYYKYAGLITNKEQKQVDKAKQRDISQSIL